MITDGYLTRILLYCGILFHLFFSFYFHDFGIAPFSLMSALILSFFCFLNFPIVKNYLPFGYNLISVCVIYLISSFLWSIFVCYINDFQFHVVSFFGFFLNLGIFFGFIGLALNEKMEPVAYRSIQLFFTISLVLFFSQAIAWYFFGMELDFLSSVTGESQRLSGHQLDVQGVVTRRASGTFAEPAIYCWVMVGIGYFLLHSMRQSNYKISVYFFHIFAVLISFSLSGWALAAVSGFLRLIAIKKVKTIFYLIVGFVIIFISFYSYIEAYWNARILVLGDDGSFNDRLNVYEVIGRIFSELYYVILGVGVSTRIETPALSFIASSLLLFGVLGTFLLLGFLVSFFYKLPGSMFDKAFILTYVVVIGNHVTSTINWFVFGCMTFLMVRNSLRESVFSAGSGK